MTRLVAVAGWSCSGKTRFARALAERLGPGAAVVLSQDDYYRDTSRLSRRERAQVNYDEPEAFELATFTAHVKALRAGRAVPVFAYDFASGARRTGGTLLPRRVVIAEGLFALGEPGADLRVFLDGDPERLLERRIRRDGAERAYSRDEVRRRFADMALPAQRRLFARAAERADLVLPMDWDERHVAAAAARFEDDTSAAPKGTAS